MEINFGASAPYTVGIEEEYQLIDPATGKLTPAIDAVLAASDAAGLPGDLLASELSASCLEMRSPIYPTVASLAKDLVNLRRTVRDLAAGCGARIAAAGTHPFSDSTEQPITRAERYRTVEKEMGWTARMQAIYGLHVHIAVPDREAAIRSVAALSRHVPLLLALSANSPFWAGSDTRLSSVRAIIFDLVPRSGLPPGFETWEDFESCVDTLVRAGSIPDYSLCWWDVRPHPRLGTVELRAPDVQTEPGRTASLAALTQCLVASAEDGQRENPLFIAENKWRAARYGLDARLHDFKSGQSASARQVATDLVRALGPVSRDLGCEEELAGVLEIVEGGTGAQRQRAVFEKRGSTEDVVRHLVAATA